MFGISSFSEAPFSALSQTVISASLTGVVADGGVGTVVFFQGPATFALSGVQAGGATGNFYVPPLLSGVQASGAVGTVTFFKDFALSGVQASGDVGNVLPVYWVLVNTSQTANWALVDTDGGNTWL